MVRPKKQGGHPVWRDRERSWHVSIPHHSKGVAPGTAKRIAMTLEGFRFDLESELKDEKETIVEERKHLQSKNYD